MKTRSLMLQKRLMEDGKMMMLIETMSNDRLFFWTTAMVSAVYESGMGAVPLPWHLRQAQERMS